MAKASRARSWNFGGIFNLKNPIKKSSTERTWRDRELYDTQFMDATSRTAISWFPESNINTHSKLHYNGHLLPQQKQFRIKCCMLIESEQLRLSFTWGAAGVDAQLLFSPGSVGTLCQCACALVDQLTEESHFTQIRLLCIHCSDTTTSYLPAVTMSKYFLPFSKIVIAYN